MEIISTDPAEHIASFEGEVLQTMIALDETISAALTGRCRVLWHGKFWGGTDQTIIGYGDISQPRPRGEDVKWFLAGLARQKRNYSIYLNAARDDHYLAHEYTERLGKVKLGAASIGFTKLENINLDVLTEANELTPPDPA